MTGTEGAHSPFFSPDGQWVAFFSAEKLKKISVQGGDALTLSTASSIKGGSWGEDGNIIASSGDVLLQIPSSGGAPTPVTELAPGEVSHCWPQVLPGGGAVLFTVLTSMAGVDGASIEAFSLKDRRRKTILRGGTWSRYLPSGHLVYVNDGTLFAAAFDLDRMQVRSTSVPILADVAYDTETGLAQIDFSGTSSGSGTVVYSSGRVGAAMVTVQWLDGFG